MLKSPCRDRRRGRSLLATAVMACACAVGLAGPVAALQTSDATPVFTFPRAVSYDLASMVLPAEDFPVEGMISNRSRFVGLDEEVTYIAPDLGMEPAEARAGLEEVGWVGRYLGDVVLPSESDPSRFLVVGSSYVTEYTDEEGAAEAFATFEDETGPDAEDIAAPEIGEESELTRIEGTEEATGLAYVSLDYTFRSGELIGGIGLTWFEDAPSEPSSPGTMAKTAEALLERMETVRDEGGTGLFGKLLRLDPTETVALSFHRESFTVRDGDVVADYDDTEEGVAGVTALVEEGGIVDMYSGESYFAPVAGGEEGAFVSRIYAFHSRRDARAFVDLAVTDFVENTSGTAYTDREVLTELPEFDGAIGGASYAFPIGDDVESTGYRLWLQVDSFVVSVEADSVEGVELELVTDLLTEQAACVESQGFCRPIAVPDELVG